MENQSQADTVVAVSHTPGEVQQGDPESGRHSNNSHTALKRGSTEEIQADTVVEVRYTQEGVHIRDPDPGRH